MNKQSYYYKSKRTLKGLISIIYNRQCKKSIERGHLKPEYTLKELKIWTLIQDNYVHLFNEWKESGYNRLKIPSIDRIDSNKPYTLDNIQLVTWRQNLDNSSYERKNGKLITKNMTPILQYKDDILINEYYSIHEASRQNNILPSSIHNNIKGISKHAGGYNWKYK